MNMFSSVDGDGPKAEDDFFRAIAMEEQREDVQKATCHQLAVGQMLGIRPEAVCLNMLAFTTWLDDQGYYIRIHKPRHLKPRQACIAVYASQQMEGALHAEYVTDPRHIRDNCVAVETYHLIGGLKHG